MILLRRNSSMEMAIEMATAFASSLVAIDLSDIYKISLFTQLQVSSITALRSLFFNIAFTLFQ